MVSDLRMTSLEVHRKSDHWRNKQNKVEDLAYNKYLKNCTLFFNKVAKIHSLSNSGQMQLCSFTELLLSLLERKNIDSICFCLTKQLRYATYRFAT